MTLIALPIDPVIFEGENGIELWTVDEDGILMENELKSCPFCGHSASLEPRPSANGVAWIVRCDARFLPNKFNELCPVNGRTRGDNDKEAATKQWNTRVTEKQND